MSSNMGFNPNVHTSRFTPYPHTDFRDTLGKLHLTFEESLILSLKHKIPLKPTGTISDQDLTELLRKALRK